MSQMGQNSSEVDESGNNSQLLVTMSSLFSLLCSYTSHLVLPTVHLFSPISRPHTRPGHMTPNTNMHMQTVSCVLTV